MTPSVMSNEEALENSCLVANNLVSHPMEITPVTPTLTSHEPMPMRLCISVDFVDHKKTFVHMSYRCLIYILNFEGIHLIFSCVWVFISENTGLICASFPSFCVGRKSGKICRVVSGEADRPASWCSWRSGMQRTQCYK